jgi:hypothetical protein
MVGPQRREFEERFREWKMIETQKFGAAENEEVELKRWQKSVINLMKQQDDRGTADWLIEVTTFVGFTVKVQLTD